jgi:uncharacterized protein (TIGR02231 family)
LRRKLFYQDAFLIVLLLAVGPFISVNGHFFAWRAKIRREFVESWAKPHLKAKFVDQIDNHMKRMLLSAALGLVWLGATAQPTTVNPQITDVTVFLNGAQVSEEATVSLNKGDNIVVFSGLAQNIDANSIQAAAPDIVMINSVSHEVNYLKQQEKQPRIKQLEDSLSLVKEKLEVLAIEKEVLNHEANLLNANQSLAGEAKGVSTEELRKLSDYFRIRMKDVSEKSLKNKRQTDDWVQTRARIQQQMQELNYQQEQPSNDIVVKLRADYARTVKVGIRYLVMDAGWTPRYDLRAKDTDSPIQLDYRADVWQNTGKDWKNVKLSLSSGDPRQGGTKPELSQWNLYFGQMQAYTRSGYDQNKGMMDYKALEKEKAKGRGEFQQRITLADYTTMRNNATTTEFAISLPQTIPSDGKVQQVSIQSATLPATYQHYAAPKLDKDAFLVARVTEWEPLNLMPGAVNIFFEGTFIAESFLDPGSTLDTLDFSLGRDKKVIIERNTLKDHNAKRDIGTNKERTFGYEFVVRNTKKGPINLVIQDQVPVSQDAEIIVKDIEISKAGKDEATGILTWNLKVQPAETQKFNLIFSVKYPKKKIVPGI